LLLFVACPVAPSSGLAAIFSPEGEKNFFDCPLSPVGERARVRGMCFWF
jgi:hypothetical protein